MIPTPPKSTTIIDYSNNLFNSSLPESIRKNLKYAYFFSVSNNVLTGVIPQTICNASYLKADKNGESEKHLSFPVFPLNGIYYEGSVTVTVKGRELELVKILTLFTSIDISSSIPPSIRNLSHLESLDMSSNRITGNIPSVLTSLPFLSSFNLSYNQLEGKIPTGRQFNTFDENSCIGNKRLCGFPLNRTCTILPEQRYAPNSPESDDEKDWRSILCGLAFGVVISVLFSIRKGYSSGTRRQRNLSR
ncbi:hypothetical protein R6Q57_017263 [Mikania cordata]